MQRNEHRPWYERMMRIDRRIIFLFVALAVILPIIFPFHMPLRPSGVVRDFYNAMEQYKHQKDVVILISGEYDPGTIPEVQPMVKATIRHALRLGYKIIIMGLWPQGPPLVQQALEEVLAEPEFAKRKFRYGEDFVNLGYMTGGFLVIKGMSESIQKTFPKDSFGNNLSELPLMKRVRDFNDIAHIFDFSAGDPNASHWVMFARRATGRVPVSAGCTAVQAPLMYPYVQSRQIVGLLGGLKGAADYEALLKTPGRATEFMAAQSVAHVVIILFILVGNAAYFAARRHRRR